MAKTDMRIVVACDLSARSDRALARAFALAAERQAPLHVLHVVDSGLPEELRAHAIAWAERALVDVCQPHRESTGVTARIEVVSGQAKADIVAHARAAKATLIVLGIHDMDQDRPAPFVETTAGVILRMSPVPVLLVREAVSGAYGQVAIGVDFSVFARAALNQAFAVAPAARFHLIHAYMVPFKGFLGSPAYSAEVMEDERLQFELFLAGEMDLLDERARALGMGSSGVERVMAEGEPAEVLVGECRRLKADLVVIGTHGRTGVSRALLGSVAAALLEAPPCDVLVAKPY